MIFSVLSISFFSHANNVQQNINSYTQHELSERQSKAGFSALLIITADNDWQAKWGTPPAKIPHFTATNEVSAGGELAILTFLSNPKLDSSGMTDVVCDLKVTRPDGSTSINKLNVPCFRVYLRTEPKHVYLTTASIKYIEEPEDPRGKWTVVVTVTDRNRGVSVTLRSLFIVK